MPAERSGREPSPRLPRRRAVTAAALALAAAGPAMTGCSEDDLGGGGPAPTQIVVDPVRFLGDVPCSSNEGAMRSYVVTLTLWEDESDPTPFVLGSSHPTPCTRKVAFRDVVTPGRLYTAEIDAYEQLAADLAPFGQASSGSRRMHDVQTGELVEPRWTTHCGDGASGGTMALSHESRYVSNCEPLADSGSSITAISFPPAAALGADPCATAASLDIVAEASGLPPATAVPCDAEPVVYDQGIESGRGYHFYATAQAGDTPLGTLCFVTAKAGQTVTPRCNAITATGDIRLSLATLQSGGEPVCPAGHLFDVLLDEELLNAVPLPCEGQAHVGPLAPADYLLDVLVFDADGQPFGSGASCTATVLPGKAVPAVCTP